MTIAGNDPTGGAGISADIRVGNSLGLHVMPIITCVTAQNSRGLNSYGILPPEVLRLQLESVREEVVPDAVKIGLIANSENLKIISDFLEGLPGSVPVVVDPILAITAGENSGKDENIPQIIRAYAEFIFPKATVVTPNLEELKLFEQTIRERNLKALIETTPIVIKGGHSCKDIIEDKLIEKEKTTSRSHPKIDSINLHGTGCVFSSFLASYMALGFTLEESFIQTSDRLHEIIISSQNYRLGSSTYGPLNIEKGYIFNIQQENNKD
ncbi:MAG: hydroxymethylpyrimidine/phosphomethylpyrimidine kinase [Muribaculaceae bacterium]|nr:hydroxymethylpyrimidine/phosphomethylpyrimidine kinase [Muribaculaceae bacterium]